MSPRRLRLGLRSPCAHLSQSQLAAGDERLLPQAVPVSALLPLAEPGSRWAPFLRSPQVSASADSSQSPPSSSPTENSHSLSPATFTSDTTRSTPPTTSRRRCCGSTHLDSRSVHNTRPGYVAFPSPRRNQPISLTSPAARSEDSRRRSAPAATERARLRYRHDGL